MGKTLAILADDYENIYGIMGHYHERRRFDHQTERLNTQSVFIYRDGSIVRWETSTRAYSLSEIESMLAENGFRVVNVFGNLEKEPYSLDMPRMLLQAQKSSE